MGGCRQRVLGHPRLAEVVEMIVHSVSSPARVVLDAGERKTGGDHEVHAAASGPGLQVSIEKHGAVNVVHCNRLSFQSYAT